MEHNYSEEDTFTCLIKAASGSWDSSAIQKASDAPTLRRRPMKLTFQSAFVSVSAPDILHAWGEGEVLYLLCILPARVRVVLSEVEWYKLNEHNGLQEPITCCFQSKVGMLQYAESTHTSATSREEQACFNLALPNCYGNTVLTTSKGM